jgi:TPR repeat protein
MKDRYLLLLVLFVGFVFIGLAVYLNLSQTTTYKRIDASWYAKMDTKADRLMQKVKQNHGKTKKDLATAYQYFLNERFRMTAEVMPSLAIQGHPQAMMIMGYLYEYGLGVSVNARKSALWYYIASRNRSAVTRHIPFEKGIKAFLGISRKTDYSKAMQWFLQAAQ